MHKYTQIYTTYTPNIHKYQYTPTIHQIYTNIHYCTQIYANINIYTQIYTNTSELPGNYIAGAYVVVCVYVDADVNTCMCFPKRLCVYPAI